MSNPFASAREYLTATGPSLSVSIVKLDNGYTLSLIQNPKHEEIVVEPAVNPFEGMDPDEIVDKMIDGMSAVIRTINDKGAGENWKDEEDRQLIREGFKILFPGLARKAIPMKPVKMPEIPRYENRVFESKEALVKYLTENL